MIVYATAGTAAPAAAAMTAEVAATTTAVGAATAAGIEAAEAAEAVTLAVRALRLLRAATTFVRPQVKLTAGLVDLDAFVQLHSTGTLHPGHLTSGAAINLATGAVPIGPALKFADHVMTPSTIGPVRRVLHLAPGTGGRPKWGLTDDHLAKHFRDAKPAYSLKTYDPLGNELLWRSYMRQLATMSATVRHASGVEDVMGNFPGLGHPGQVFRFGIRISPSEGDGYHLVTLLTHQGGVW